MSACLTGKWVGLWDKLLEAGLLDPEPTISHLVAHRRSLCRHILKEVIPFLFISFYLSALRSLSLVTALPLLPGTCITWCGGQECKLRKPTVCWFKFCLCHLLAEWLQARGVLTLGLHFLLY